LRIGWKRKQPERREPPELPGRFPKIQIRTVAEILAGKRLEFPQFRIETFQRAERRTKTEQRGLF
jgi:hypothetical protein